jgi:radical SAM superfamily enzyme YgiQ (UPF0313 family)
VDVTVQGQGEVTFAELVDRLALGQDLVGLPGTAVRPAPGAPPVTNPARGLTNVNHLPPLDYSLIDVEAYFAAKGQRQLDYISSAGCPYRCAFCADPFVFGRRWTGIEPSRVGEEVEALWRRYRFQDLAFQDETFFASPRRVVGIAEEFLRRGLSITWTATMRADQAARLPEEALALCRRSGLRRVMIGVESGSPQMLEWMNKDITLEQVLDSAQRCLRHGLGAIFPFIVGFPGESPESLRQTLQLIKRLRALSPQFETPIYYYRPYPGSRIAAEVAQAGYQLPDTLEGWADFDFVGGPGPWMDEEAHRLVERFRFYNRLAWGPRVWPRRLLQGVARWRCRHDWYRLPVEKALVERLRPGPRLS